MSVYSVSVGMDGISGELMRGDRAEKVRAFLIERAEHDAELADLLRRLGFIPSDAIQLDVERLAKAIEVLLKLENNMLNDIGKLNDYKDSQELL